MCRWVWVAPLLLLAGCLARVTSTTIQVREPELALERSAAVFKKEGFGVSTLERGLVRTRWRFTERRDGDGFLYYRYLVEQADPEGEQIAFRIEVVRCEFQPTEDEDWGRSGCARMPPRVPLWAEDDYRRIAEILKRVHRPKAAP